MSNELIHEVKALHHLRQTGLLMIHVNNQIATVGLVSGQIAYWFFNQFTGRAAVTAFQAALSAHPNAVRWSFRAGAVADNRQPDLPLFTDIMAVLEQTELA